jgi:NADPH-dependent 2,4-dienoyl-CoA reductase/sulfur reductase-like enzyme
MIAGTKSPDVPPMFVPEGPLVGFADKIKKHVAVPVITVAGIVTPEFAEDIIASGRADMVAIGRAMFADPHWALKIAKGREAEIVHCIRCNVCHKHIVIDRAGAVKCTVNPGLLEKKSKPAARRRKVIVVGAGPAGLEAALTASERGHDVLLYEKSDSIGGNVKYSCIPPFKKDLRIFLDYYEKRLKNIGVQYIPGQEMTPERVMEEKADAVIIAVGAEEHLPDFPGAHGLFEATARKFYQKSATHRRGKGRVGIIGAGTVGCELAWYLLLLGRRVLLIDVLPRQKWLSEEHPTNRFILLENLDEQGIQVLDDAIVLEVGETEKYIRLVRDAVEYNIFVDDIVLAAGYHRRRSFGKELQRLLDNGGAPEIHEIGDCTKATNIYQTPQSSLVLSRRQIKGIMRQLCPVNYLERCNFTPI